MPSGNPSLFAKPLNLAAHYHIRTVKGNSGGPGGVAVQQRVSWTPGKGPGNKGLQFQKVSPKTDA